VLVFKRSSGRAVDAVQVHAHHAVIERFRFFSPDAFGVGVNSEAGCSQAAGVSTNSLAMANDLSTKSCE
jgi:hypothetical protein